MHKKLSFRTNLFSSSIPLFVTKIAALLLMLELVPVASVVGQNELKPFFFRIQNGDPDLVLQVTASPKEIYGGPNLDGINESSEIMITVENRLATLRRPFIFGEWNHFRYDFFGSDVQGVQVLMQLPPSLRKVGNITAPVGFTCGVTGNNQMVCGGGRIPAGDTVSFYFDVIGGYGCGYEATIQAEVDPYSWINEVSETNNNSSTSIFVSSIC